MISEQTRETTPVQPVSSLQTEPPQRRKIRVNRISMPIASIVGNQAVWVNIPEFQRDVVWPLHFKQDLINRILLGAPFDAIQLNEEEDEKNYVGNGQQRLSAIIEYYHNMFKTKKSSDYDGDLEFPAIEPGRYYRALSEQAQNDFLTYQVHFDIYLNVPRPMLGYLYRGAQNMVPLTAAEKYKSYASRATRAALEIAHHHPFFLEPPPNEPDTRIYKGKTLRQQAFYAVLTTMRLEELGGFANVGPRIIKDFAMGKSDAKMTPSFIETLNLRYEMARHLYTGTAITSHRYILPIYQSILLLDNLGIELATVPSRTLSAWWEQIINEDAAQRRRGHRTLAASMGEVMHQRQFWKANLGYIASLPGMAEPGDSSRIASQVESVVSWLQKEGVCPVCNEHAKLSERKLHAFGSTVFKHSCRDRLRASS